MKDRDNHQIDLSTIEVDRAITRRFHTNTDSPNYSQMIAYTGYKSYP